MLVPYKKFEILAAVNLIDEKLLAQGDSIQEALGKILNIELPQLHLQAAQYHGVTVLDLINSPNYEVLTKSYQETLVSKAIQHLESAGFSNVESWAIICVIYGVLDL